MSQLFHIHIADDKLVATLQLQPDASVTEDAVLAAAGELRLVDIDAAALRSAIAKPSNKPVTIATGAEPVDEQPGDLECRMPVASDERGATAKVREGQLVASFGEARAGVDGRDVFGSVIAFKKPGTAVVAGRGVVLVNGQFKSEAQGNLRLQDNVLSVEPLLELHDGKRDALTQTDFAGDIAVMGHLGDGSRVHAAGSVIINGAIGAANVNAGRGLNVRSGICGRDKGRCIVTGDVWTKLITHGCVIAGGDISVKAQVEHSRIVCAGRLTVADGAIVGGKMLANGGVACRTIGDAAGTPTVIEVGGDKVAPLIVAALRMEMEADIQRAKSIREKIEPLMKQLKNLDARQRERVTELMYEADQLDARTQERNEKLASKCRSMLETATEEVLVSDTLHAGVILRLGRLETTIAVTRQGNLRVATRGGDDGPEIVLINEGNESVTVLHSRPIEATPPAKAA